MSLTFEYSIIGKVDISFSRLVPSFIEKRLELMFWHSIPNTEFFEYFLILCNIICIIILLE